MSNSTHPTPTQPILDKLLFARKDAAFVLSMSIRTIDCLIAGGQLRTVRRGGRVLIHRDELILYASPEYGASERTA
jgi:excisionase family DNA binding protein